MIEITQKQVLFKHKKNRPDGNRDGILTIKTKGKNVCEKNDLLQCTEVSKNKFHKLHDNSKKNPPENEGGSQLKQEENFHSLDEFSNHIT